MSENHGRQFGGWIYECNIPISVLAEHKKHKTQLSYMPLSCNSGPLVKVKVGPMTQSKPSRKQDLGLCVPPLFGELSISATIQFIELWKILGASHFTFYLHDVSSSISRLLNFYHSRGEVTLLNWRLPDHIQNTEIWYHASYWPFRTVSTGTCRNSATSVSWTLMNSSFRPLTSRFST